MTVSSRCIPCTLQIRRSDSEPTVTLWVGEIFLAELYHDARMEPPWCARNYSCGLGVNGWKKPEHRFATEEEGLAFLLQLLGQPSPE